jgi:hypothetical protein
MESTIDNRFPTDQDEWTQVSKSNDVAQFAGKFVAYTVNGSGYIGSREGYRLRKRDIRYAHVDVQASNWAKDWRVGFNISIIKRPTEVVSNCALTDKALANAEMFMRFASEKEVAALVEAVEQDNAKLIYYSKRDTLTMLQAFWTMNTQKSQNSSKLDNWLWRTKIMIPTSYQKSNNFPWESVILINPTLRAITASLPLGLWTLYSPH